MFRYTVCIRVSAHIAFYYTTSCKYCNKDVLLKRLVSRHLCTHTVYVYTNIYLAIVIFHVCIDQKSEVGQGIETMKMRSAPSRFYFFNDMNIRSCSACEKAWSPVHELVKSAE